MDLTRAIRQVAKAIVPESVLLKMRARRALATELELAAAVRLSKGGDFIDVGANVGAWSAAAAPAFARVHAFEPHAGLAARLNRIAPANVVVHNVALSDRPGSAELLVPVIDGVKTLSRATLEPTANRGARCEPQHVIARTLDSYAFTRVDVIKIDVEGHEMPVLKGAEQTLRHTKPSIVVEIEERHHSGASEAIIDWVCSLGFDCFYFLGGQVAEFHAGDIAALQSSPPAAVGKRSPNYVNNFLFLSRERPESLARVRSVLE